MSNELITDEELERLTAYADQVEQERKEDDGCPYETYGTASEQDGDWWVCLEPEKARRLVAEIRRLRSMLTDLEWAGGTYREEAACPVCHEVQGEKHGKDCALAAVVRQHREKRP